MIILVETNSYPYENLDVLSEDEIDRKMKQHYKNKSKLKYDYGVEMIFKEVK